MKQKIILYLALLNLAFADVSNTSILQKQRHLFTFEQRLQRQHLDQMRYDAEYQWRGWGLTNLGGKYTFVGDRDAYVMVSPLVGFDRAYGLENARLLVGFDTDINYSKFFAYGDTMQSVGYGLGGYVMWMNDSEVYLSLGARFFQGFLKVYGEDLRNAMWIFNLNGGKRFNLVDDYFIDADFHFGTGALLDQKLSFEQNNVSYTHILNPLIPLNLRAGTSLGKNLANNQRVRVGVAAEFEYRLGGEAWIETSQTLKQIDEKVFLDLFCSIAYDVNITENVFFYTYADFATLHLQANFGLGIQASFGESTQRPLKYRKFKLKKLPNTDLK